MVKTPKGVTFRYRDLMQAIRGAAHAGVEVRRIEIETSGKIVMHMAQPGKASGWSTTVQEAAPETAAA
jgi:hypothetical protein